MEEHKQNIKQLQSQYEVDLNLMKKEHALSAMKVDVDGSFYLLTILNGSIKKNLN